MTRQQVLAAVEKELGRKLTSEETEFVNAFLDQRDLGGNDSFDEPVVQTITGALKVMPEDAAESGTDAFKPTEVEREVPGRNFEADIGGKPVSGVSSAATSDFGDRFFAAAAEAGIPREDAEQIFNATAQQVVQFGGDLEGLLLPLMQDWELQAEQLKGRPIGVPDDFVAQTFAEEEPASSGLERWRMQQGLPSETRRPVEVEPRYFDGDQYSPAGMPPEEIIKIQKRLEKAGLLSSYIPGLWDSGTASAYTEVLAAANRRGSSADDALDFMVDNPVEEVKEKFRAPAYVKPDYATLAQDVKSVMRSKLGREPTAEEMAELTGAMSSAYRADFDAQVAAMRSEFDAAPGEIPATVQDVDPFARFNERFEAKFRPEIDRLAALPETRENMNNVFASLKTMGSLIG